jgi:Uma2 family endonuclease
MANRASFVKPELPLDMIQVFWYTTFKEFAMDIYTYDEYSKLDLPPDKKFELRDGKIYMMASPLMVHVEIVKQLYDRINEFLHDKPCKVYSFEVGVRPKPRNDRSDKDQLKPDIVVICDKDKVKKDGIEGAPDLIIEVLSPSTADVDRDDKRHKYEDAGVREYWIVSPHERTVETFVLDERGRFMQDCFSLNPDHPDRKVAVAVLPGLEIKLAEVFTE